MYLNFFLTSLVEIPGNAFAIYAMNRLVTIDKKYNLTNCTKRKHRTRVFRTGSINPQTKLTLLKRGKKYKCQARERHNRARAKRGKVGSVWENA